MIVTIASGKGGTGKTTVAINLALVAGSGVRLLDCDVEEPNCHVFLSPDLAERLPVEVMIPEVDEDKCTECGLCGEICEYSAIISLQTVPLVFPELCHSCYGCLHVCPEEAISVGGRLVGEVEIGSVDGMEFYGGRLRIGESHAPPLIRAVKKNVNPSELTIIDAPPGASCPVVEAIKGSDYVILVTEPTPFGLHDLKLAVAMVRELGYRFGVVINRADIGDDMAREYCRAEGIPVLLEIPDDRRIAEAYSRGKTIVEALPEYTELFRDLLSELERRVAE